MKYVLVNQGLCQGLLWRKRRMVHRPPEERPRHDEREPSAQAVAYRELHHPPF